MEEKPISSLEINEIKDLTEKLLQSTESGTTVHKLLAIIDNLTLTISNMKEYIDILEESTIPDIRMDIRDLERR